MNKRAKASLRRTLAKRARIGFQNALADWLNLREPLETIRVEQSIEGWNAVPPLMWPNNPERTNLYVPKWSEVGVREPDWMSNDRTSQAKNAVQTYHWCWDDGELIRMSHEVFFYGTCCTSARCEHCKEEVWAKDLTVTGNFCPQYIRGYRERDQWYLEQQGKVAYIKLCSKCYGRRRRMLAKERESALFRRELDDIKRRINDAKQGDRKRRTAAQVSSDGDAGRG